jgi:hypothetical protein
LCVCLSGLFAEDADSMSKAALEILAAKPRRFWTKEEFPEAQWALGILNSSE